MFVFCFSGFFFFFCFMGGQGVEVVVFWGSGWLGLRFGWLLGFRPSDFRNNLWKWYHSWSIFLCLNNDQCWKACTIVNDHWSIFLLFPLLSKSLSTPNRSKHWGNSILWPSFIPVPQKKLIYALVRTMARNSLSFTVMGRCPELLPKLLCYFGDSLDDTYQKSSLVARFSGQWEKKKMK